ncbi:nucleoside transporter 4, putative [Plasmodium ovale]|uniref:Nucleoside transporter 4, putative n=1 Tax=Plasmodium ovale TaxID=36330 RepID=A0A1D3KWU4_PLAOA|nr:nucleoside transporter 4, putative [Plasmodium ovale]
MEEKNTMLKGEEVRIRSIFFFIGLLLSLPSHVIVNVSFLINYIYKEEIFVTIMGIVSGCMIISSLFQLTFEKTSFKSIMICNILNTVNLIVLVIFICIYKVSKYYVYVISSIIGLYIGYLYSACTKYSLLLTIKVNGYMVTGISFSALFFFTINLLMSYFTIEDGNIQSYYNAISLSVCTIIFLEFLIILYIFYIQFNSPFFLKEQEKIESQICTCNNNGINHNGINHNGINHNGINHNGNNDNDDTTNDDTTNVNTEKLNELEIGKGKNVNNNNSDVDKHAISLFITLKKKVVNFKNMFNCTNIFHGARLVKYYYVCLIPISFSIFISSIAYPHMIPNKLKKGVYLKYMFMFLYQISDVLFSILVTVYLTAFNFFKQKYVAVLCISRIILLGLSFTIKNLKDGDFMYSNAFISLIIFLLGSTNGSLINISYARIGDCFEESDKKEKKIAVSSSFCALCLLMSFAMAPWFCKMIIDL